MLVVKWCMIKTLKRMAKHILMTKNCNTRLCFQCLLSLHIFFFYCCHHSYWAWMNISLGGTANKQWKPGTHQNSDLPAVLEIQEPRLFLFTVHRLHSPRSSQKHSPRSSPSDLYQPVHVSERFSLLSDTPTEKPNLVRNMALRETPGTNFKCLLGVNLTFNC